MSENKTQEKDTIVEVTNPLVFISHDTRDAKLAEAFSALLKGVSAGVLKSFRSSDNKGTQGIEYGVGWFDKIIENIQNASDVVCLLTERSIDRPWILFEAGMAKGRLETPILGMALGVSLNEASSGPFAQFQNCGDDEESLTKLVVQLVDRIPNSEPDRDTIKSQVEKFKKSVVSILEEDEDTESADLDSTNNDNSSAKLFEEIKVMFQDLHHEVATKSQRLEFNDRKVRYFQPQVVEKLINTTQDKSIGIMAALSLIKESMPWIYEHGVNTVKKIKLAKTKKEKKELFFEFSKMVDFTTCTPLMRKLFMVSPRYVKLIENAYEVLLKKLNMLIENNEI